MQITAYAIVPAENPTDFDLMDTVYEKPVQAQSQLVSMAIFMHREDAETWIVEGRSCLLTPIVVPITLTL